MFEDIKNSSDWQSVDKVSKGWSSDSKYFIKTKEGKMLLLRISDMEQYETKKKEYEIVEKYSILEFATMEKTCICCLLGLKVKI